MGTLDDFVAKNAVKSGRAQTVWLNWVPLVAEDGRPALARRTQTRNGREEVLWLQTYETISGKWQEAFTFTTKDGKEKVGYLLENEAGERVAFSSGSRILANAVSQAIRSGRLTKGVPVYFQRLGQGANTRYEWSVGEPTYIDRDVSYGGQQNEDNQPY